MEVSWPENLALAASRPSTITAQNMVIQELMVGRELASQLRTVLAMSDGSGSEKELMMRILKSFSNSISILNAKNCVETDSCFDPPCLDARKVEEKSQESCRNSTTTTPTKKERRGWHNMRRNLLRTSEIDTPTLINDGQTWRKYGQKVILNAKHPRNYFRCTYKYNHGCKATKQVQRIQVNPPLYRTTYFGQHTCKDLHKNPELILDCITSPCDTSMFISFDSTNYLTNKQEQQPFVSSFSSIKQEHKKEITSCDMNHNQLSLSDGLVSPDLTAFESHDPMLTMLSSTMESYDLEDLVAGMMEYVDFDLLDVSYHDC